MKAATDASPVPGGWLTVVVIHAVEIGPPARAGFGRKVLQRLQKCVGNEHFGGPACDFALGRRSRNLLAYLASIAFLEDPRLPAQQFPTAVRHHQRKLRSER